MHHLADSMTKLCDSGKHNNACGESIQMHFSSGEKAGPDSANGRASTSGAGGRGFDPGPRHTKDVKNGTSGYLAWCSAL